MKKSKIIKRIIAAAGITAMLFLLPFFAKIFAPFIPAFVIAAAVQPQIGFLERKIKISRGISSVVLVTFFVAAVTVISVAAVFKLVAQAKNIALALPAFAETVGGFLNELQKRLGSYTHKLPADTLYFLGLLKTETINRAKSISVPISERVFAAARNFAYSMPDIILFVIVFIISTFFFIKDYRLVINFMHEVIPIKLIEPLRKIKKVMSKAFSSYIKAQLILMFITSATVTVCLWITGMKNPLLGGVLCGAVDALPVLGTAAVLVPWALFSLVCGDTYRFAVLIIIQVLAFLVRQLSEPKIVSRQIGIHPLLTLVSIYVGLRFFGLLGMIFAPALMLLAVNIYVSFKETEG